MFVLFGIVLVLDVLGRILALEFAGRVFKLLEVLGIVLELEIPGSTFAL